MKKNLALFSVLAIFTFLLSSTPSFAHSRSNAGAVIAGTVAGIAAGVVIGNAVHSPKYYHHPKRHYKPRPYHTIGCSCHIRPIHVHSHSPYSHPYRDDFYRR